MKVIEQISNRRFVVEVENSDIIDSTEVTFQHDYFRITSKGSIFTEDDLDNNIVIDGINYGNTIPCRMEGDLGIREFQKVADFYNFNTHPYMQSDHLIDYNDKPNYTWNESPLALHNPCTHKTSYFVREKDKFYEIPKGIYDKLININYQNSCNESDSE